MNTLFITGTDTDVGKTTVCGLLAAYMAAKGHRIVTQKWVQSGIGDQESDLAQHNRWWPCLHPVEERCAYVFAKAASPHLAAEEVGVEIDPSHLIAQTNALSRAFEYVLVEGSGGWNVPYCRTATLGDVAASLHLPVLIVADNRVGAINHCLLTIAAIRQRNLPILGVLFNDVSGTKDPSVLRDNPMIVGTYGQVDVFGSLPYVKNDKDLMTAFEKIAEPLYAKLCPRTE